MTLFCMCSSCYQHIGSLCCMITYHFTYALQEEPGSMLAITNATIIDGGDHEPLERATLLIDGERISAVGRVDIPRDATVIDANGGSVLPGLIDTHVHFAMEYPDRKS